MRLRALALAAGVAAASAGCGYRAAARGAPLAGSPSAVFVAPFDGRTADAEVGAWMAEALRVELGRRGLAGGPGAPARIEGGVDETTAWPSSANGATWRLVLAASARLVMEGKPTVETRVRREVEFLAGQDPLEIEGRRRLALRRATEAAAREIVEKLEVP